ncbi:MAG: type II toxin-antitoxin system HicA family toxin [Candidatus Bathyarchaeia archaeon]|jgi:predicted RNA binding protein YcfA (HicA-like mRNA interferase family)
MPKLKPVSGLKIIKALGKAGFQVVGRKGSHVRLKRKTADRVYIVVVPVHPEVKTGTLKSILRQAGLTDEEFADLLKK